MFFQQRDKDTHKHWSEVSQISVRGTLVEQWAQNTCPPSGPPGNLHWDQLPCQVRCRQVTPQTLEINSGIPFFAYGLILSTIILGGHLWKLRGSGQDKKVDSGTLICNWLLKIIRKKWPVPPTPLPPSSPLRHEATLHHHAMVAWSGHGPLCHSFPDWWSLSQLWQFTAKTSGSPSLRHLFYSSYSFIRSFPFDWHTGWGSSL